MSENEIKHKFNESTYTQQSGSEQHSMVGVDLSQALRGYQSPICDYTSPLWGRSLASLAVLPFDCACKCTIALMGNVIHRCTGLRFDSVSTDDDVGLRGCAVRKAQRIHLLAVSRHFVVVQKSLRGVYRAACGKIAHEYVDHLSAMHRR